MKKFFSSISTIAFFSLILAGFCQFPSQPAGAANSQPGSGSSSSSCRFVVSSSFYEVDGVQYVMDAAPYIYQGRTFVPITYVACALGIDIDWDGGSQRATLSKGAIAVQIQIGSNIMHVNGLNVMMDVFPQITNGRTCLPISPVCQAFGKRVSWDSATQTITITTTTQAVETDPVNTDVVTNRKAEWLDNLTIYQNDHYRENEGDSYTKPWISSENKDLNGEYYQHGLLFRLARWNYKAEKSWVYNSYLLNGKYSEFNGKLTICGEIDGWGINKNPRTVMNVYGDGNLLYRSEYISQSNSPQSFNIPVKGVNVLKVEFTDVEATEGGTYFGLINPELI